MSQLCRTPNSWFTYKTRVRGRLKQLNVMPSDGYERIPYPHVFGPNCFCRPEQKEENGIPTYIHDHPFTEARADAY